MRKVVIAMALVTILSGCGKVEEVPTPTMTPSIEVSPTPTTTMEVVDRKPSIESKPIVVKPHFYISDYERRFAECIVMGEAGGEPYEGQVLVAQCILNACVRDGIRPSEVRWKYKYSGWNENPTESVKQAVSAVFDDGYKVVDDFIMYFYAPKYAKGTWHETQCHVITVGGHKFFKEWED